MQPPTSFFLPAPHGNLFAMYYFPAENVADSGDLLYVHPFAGEMFAARRMIAACARELAAAGTGVLTVDLHGCGDSDGDDADARWEIWHNDLAAAVQWLQAQGRDRLSLWGLRLGALLATDFAAQSQIDCEKIVLWEPVVSGSQMLNQFFRMNLDEADNNGDPARLTKPEQRNLLADNEIVDVAGYRFSPALIRAIDELGIASLGKLVAAPIDWFDFAETSDRPLPLESLSVMERWKKSGVRVNAHRSVSSPFWLFPHCCDPQPLAESLKAVLFGADATAVEGE